MLLKDLTIHRQQSWEDNPGEFSARMVWEDADGQSVTVQLDKDISKALLSFCAPLLVRFSTQAAQKIADAVQFTITDSESKTLIEDKKEDVPF